MYCQRLSSAYSSCHIASAVSICRHFWPFCAQHGHPKKRMIIYNKRSSARREGTAAGGQARGKGSALGMRKETNTKPDAHGHTSKHKQH
jgi:hypothetical protein